MYENFSKNLRPKALKLDDFSQEILQVLQEISLCDDPILYGGRLRDMFLSRATGIEIPVVDRDILLCIEDEPYECFDLPDSEKQAMIDAVFAQIAESDFFDDIDIKFQENANKIIFETSYKGTKVDITIQIQRVTPEQIANNTDAPMNGIAIDLEGPTAANPNFRWHLKNQRFEIADTVLKPLLPYSVVRFLRLKSRPHFERLSLWREGSSRELIPSLLDFNIATKAAIDMGLSFERDKTLRKLGLEEPSF